jgi:glucokinase
MTLKHKEWYVGIDLGGTSIKLALISSDGEIGFKTEAPTNVTNGGDHILYQMNKMIDRGLENLQLKRSQVKGIGIGAPAFLDMETGFVHEAVNLGWKNFALKDKLQELAQLPVIVDNDANIAALGEMWKGAGEGAKDILCVTLGTGVGGGVIINGQIHHGAKGTSGEIGHVTVVFDRGFRCNCGKTGCLETVASATGIVRLTQEALRDGRSSLLQQIMEEKGKLEAKDIAISAEKGDKLSLEILDRVGNYLGLALGNHAVVMNPEKIVIGGGVSRAGDVLFKPIRNYYQKYALAHLTGSIGIVPATLGNDAGVIGAAWLVQTKLYH